MVLLCGKYPLSFARPLIMGVLNVTPDSFSDGGKFLELKQSLTHADVLIAEGASFMVSGEWWIALFPGLALMIAVFCFNLLGDGLRDIVDPQRRT